MPEAAFGTVSTSGIVSVLVATGNGLAKVTLVEVGDRPAALNGGTYAPGAADQKPCSTAAAWAGGVALAGALR